MNAQEMFEELGYKKAYEKHPYFITLENSVSNQTLVFNTITKELFIHTQNIDNEYVRSGVSINLQLAITQQMKELGWIE